MSVINPELHELQQQVAELRVRVANAEGKIDEVSRTASGTVRQTIWQFVIFTVTMAAVLLGGLNYQTEALRREFNARFEALEQRIELSDKSTNARFDDMNKRFDDMNKRFEDLKQVVLSRR
jgi:TolA-binding protein